MDVVNVDKRHEYRARQFANFRIPTFGEAGDCSISSGVVESVRLCWCLMDEYC